MPDVCQNRLAQWGYPRPDGGIMCWMCDHPDATHDDYLAMMRDKMNYYGWAIEGVERDGDHPPRACTVGLTQYGRPELVITGISITRGADLLNQVAAHLLHSPATPRPGQQFRWAGGPLGEDRRGRGADRAPQPGRRLVRPAGIRAPVSACR